MIARTEKRFFIKLYSKIGQAVVRHLLSASPELHLDKVWLLSSSALSWHHPPFIWWDRIRVIEWSLTNRNIHFDSFEYGLNDMRQIHRRCGLSEVVTPSRFLNPYRHCITRRGHRPGYAYLIYKYIRQKTHQEKGLLSVLYIIRFDYASFIKPFKFKRPQVLLRIRATVMKMIYSNSILVRKMLWCQLQLSFPIVHINKVKSPRCSSFQTCAQTRMDVESYVERYVNVIAGREVG